MPQPYVILTTKASVDGRADTENPLLLYNRLEEYRIQGLRSAADAIITSAQRLIEEDPEFPVKESGGFPAVVIVDKGIETPPGAKVLKNKSRKMILATCKTSNKSKIRRIQEERPDLMVMEFGEHAVNLEDMLWELHRADIRNTVLEGDSNLNMRMLGHGLVDEVYVMFAPVIVGQPNISVFEGKFERNIDMNLEGILQYGDNVVLHYHVIKHRR